MRKPRGVRRAQDTNYHCTSRTVEGQFLFAEQEREYFCNRVAKLARFCQVQVPTFTCLANHFHVVVRVPARIQISDQELLEALGRFYGPKHTKTRAFGQALQQPEGSALERLRAGYLARMGNLSVFFKELKEGFSKWFNEVHQRFGTLWAERFRSVFVSDDPHWFLSVVMYVDLNSVRAGLVPLPEDYLFSGFGQAVAREGPAREALARILPGGSWEEKLAAYRLRLYARGACPTRTGQAVLNPEAVYALYQSGGQLSLGQALLLKVRGFTEGIALGSQEFLNEIAELQAGPKRPRKGQIGWPMMGADWKGLMTLKKIKEPFQLPTRQA